MSRELDIPAAQIDIAGSLRRDYLLDSVAAVNILFEIENRLDVTIEPSLIAHVDTIQEIYQQLLEVAVR